MVGLIRNVGVSTIAACLFLTLLSGQASQLNAQVKEAFTSASTLQEAKHNQSVDSEQTKTYSTG
ncbi:hypothetical protein [uncultured Rubinisphaera sp.]|uniref:hypothetical protein n=1 Tax=uncultured Rubinisphaera sp. TaxID=1678686 RepID=UPI0030DC42C0